MPDSNSVPVAVVGASGYTGEMLLRLLGGHPSVDLVAVTSRQYAGKTLGTVFPRFAGHTAADLEFIEPEAGAIAKTGAKAAFEAISGVAQVETLFDEDHQHSFRLHVDGEIDVAGAIWKLCAENNWPVRELRRDNRTLEQVFRDLTGATAKERS